MSPSFDAELVSACSDLNELFRFLMAKLYALIVFWLQIALINRIIKAKLAVLFVLPLRLEEPSHRFSHYIGSSSIFWVTRESF